MAETELQIAMRQLKIIRKRRDEAAKLGLTGAVESLNLEIDMALDYILELKRKK